MNNSVQLDKVIRDIKINKVDEIPAFHVNNYTSI